MRAAKLQSLLQTAIAHHRAGRLDEAEALYGQARAVAPKSFDAVHLSGVVAYQQGRFPQAAELLARAHALDRRHAVCQMRLGLALLALNRFAEGEKHLRSAATAKPDLPEAWENLAHCLKLQDRLTDAIACHQKVVALSPKSAAAWSSCGFTLSLAGRAADALLCHERALAVDPHDTAARYGRAQALHQTHRTTEAVADYAAVLAANPRHHGARSNRLFALHTLDTITREQLFQEHVAYGAAIAGNAAEVNFAGSADPQRLLRVAVLSPDLRQHSCAYFIEPMLRHLDSSQFELLLYHDHFREDAVSQRLRSLTKRWRNFVGQSNDAVERIVRADAPDIMIDLAGHTGVTNRLPLFARRLAPVQVSYLGYPNTTGVPAMDYRFTDAIADPPGEADAFATEELIRFAPTAWCYDAPAEAPDVTSLPCVTRGYATFGCFNDLSKITDRMLGRWARLLQQLPTSRLVLKGRGLGEGAVHDLVVRRLSQAGLPIDRVALRERTPDTREHLAVYGEIDIALDTFPYHGTTTTCEALWMGVPVISMVGDRHASRVGASLLRAVGHAEWLAGDDDTYVKIATDLACNREHLANIRSELRGQTRQSPLCDFEAQATRFGEALRKCWVAWCGRGRVAASAGP